MAHIIYGVSGEGSGHSSRAREMLSHLLSKGHTVRVVSYGRGYQNLGKDFDTVRVAGLRIVSADNRVSRLKTLTHNINEIPRGKSSLNRLRTLFKEFRPDCVITDFEPMTAYLSNHYDIPLISIDNQHRMRYMSFPCPKEYRKDALIATAVIRAMVPRPTVSLVTTFYFGRVKNPRTFLFPPILRQAVLHLKASDNGHILVYITAGYKSLLNQLKTFSRERFIVYGYDRTGREGPLQYRPFSREGFLKDLSTCKGVMATAGFTLMTESFYLRKPVLAFPMQGQFEQILNGIMLDDLGYGRALASPRREGIESYLYSIPDYAERLSEYKYEGNTAITGKLDELLDGECGLLKEFQKKRNKNISLFVP